jgi:8-oxo-dGTP pyrophosphatase MutT (NUDIX family)
MTTFAPSPIRIAAAIIDDEQGRLLLVRKVGTTSFMQAGGKIELGESPWSALKRELIEEVGLDLAGQDQCYIGCFAAAAANEAGRIVEAELFHVRAGRQTVTAAEIAEARWVTRDEAALMSLAPLTREHVLPLSVKLADVR